MIFEASTIFTGELILSEAEQQTIQTEAIQVRIQQCIALLDLTDSHIVLCLQAFSTPADEALERLRAELETLQWTIIASPVAVISCSAVVEHSVYCQSLLNVVNSQVHLLGSAAGAVRCALSYLSSELDALAICNEHASALVVLAK